MDKTILEKIGKTGLVEMQGLQIAVTIKDIRFSFGRIDALIEPIAGYGEKWVTLNSIKIDGEGEGK